MLRNIRDGRSRWRLVGNAVSVPIAEWIGNRLNAPGEYNSQEDREFVSDESWPNAAWYMGERRMVAMVSEYPVYSRRGRLSAVATEKWPNLSKRALTGFTTRAREGKLKYPSGILEALEENLKRGDCGSVTHKISNPDNGSLQRTEIC